MIYSLTILKILSSYNNEEVSQKEDLDAVMVSELSDYMSEDSYENSDHEAMVNKKESQLYILGSGHPKRSKNLGLPQRCLKIFGIYYFLVKKHLNCKRLFKQKDVLISKNARV